MSNILRVGLVVDGPTDQRFLPPVVQRTYENLVLSCPGQIEVFDVEVIQPNGKSFVDRVFDGAKKAYEQGFDIIVVHSDAEALENKLIPAFKKLEGEEGDICKNAVPLVTVRMVEAWMLADVSLLKEEIGTSKSNQDLGLIKQPKSYPDPKWQIEEAIRLAYSGRSSRQRDQVSISELYQPLGQQIDLSSLRQLPSFQSFEEEVQKSLVRRGFLSENE